MIYADKLSAQIAIGAMDEKLELKVITGTTLNAIGEVTATTTTDTTLACYVEQNQSDEADINDKQTVIDYKHFITRYKACTVKDKVIYNGNTYDIIRIEEMGRKRFMKLKCKLVE